MRSLLLASAALSLSTGVYALDGSGGSMASAPSASVPQVDAAAEYRKGVDALQAQRYAEAKKAFTRVLGWHRAMRMQTTSQASLLPGSAI